MTVLDWLLDSDPSIRWQVMRDLTDEPAEVVAAERAKVATRRVGRQLLALQAADGQWGGGTYFPEWTSTTTPSRCCGRWGWTRERAGSPRGRAGK